MQLYHLTLQGPLSHMVQTHLHCAPSLKFKPIINTIFFFFGTLANCTFDTYAQVVIHWLHVSG